MKPVVPPTDFTTGFDVEEHSVNWTIEDFSAIRKHSSLINAQKICFSTGSKVGRPSKWSVFLQEYPLDGNNWLGIFYNIEKPKPPVTDETWKNVYAEMSYAMEGTYPWKKKALKTLQLLPVASFTRGVGFHELFDRLTFGTSMGEKLIIKITLKLHVPKSTEVCQLTPEALRVKFASQANKDLALVLENLPPGNDIKIISKDKKEFSVYKGILAVRSPVLDAMTRTDMLEANSGVIDLPDISSRALQILLTFLNTGELHPDWREPEVVVELTNAAAKYQLQDLLQFLDVMLGKVCKTENVLTLFTLAHQLSLRTAEVELLKHIHAHPNSPDIIYKMVAGVLVSEGIASVDTFPKRKSLWSRLRRFRLLFARNGKQKQ